MPVMQRLLAPPAVLILAAMATRAALWRAKAMEAGLWLTAQVRLLFELIIIPVCWLLIHVFIYFSDRLELRCFC
jgi:hypothetical protein